MSKTSGPDCVPVVDLKCKRELSYILAELSSMSPKEFCFSGSWEISPVLPVFKRSVVKNYRPGNL